MRKPLTIITQPFHWNYSKRAYFPNEREHFQAFPTTLRLHIPGKVYNSFRTFHRTIPRWGTYLSTFPTVIIHVKNLIYLIALIMMKGIYISKNIVDVTDKINYDVSPNEYKHEIVLVIRDDTNLLLGNAYPNVPTK